MIPPRTAQQSNRIDTSNVPLRLHFSIDRVTKKNNVTAGVLRAGGDTTEFQLFAERLIVELQTHLQLARAISLPRDLTEIRVGVGIVRSTPDNVVEEVE